MAIYQLLVARGAKPIDPVSFNHIALVGAASRGDVAGMESALKNGARINGSVKAEGRTALNAALRVPLYERKDATAISWLLDHGADPNARDDGLFDLPLVNFVESSAGTLNGIKSIKEDDWNELSGRAGRKLTSTEIIAVNEETLRRLLKADAKVSGTDRNGWTPLHATARFDNIMAAEILINEGAKIMPRDFKEKTPLDYAESAAMIRLLKENGATER
jgi:ankyrin repeat protein